MIGWLRRWWNRHRREIDMRILWPACLKGAPSLDHAKAAFAYHALHDDAWGDLSHDEIVAFIDKLEAE